MSLFISWEYSDIALIFSLLHYIYIYTYIYIYIHIYIYIRTHHHATIIYLYGKLFVYTVQYNLPNTCCIRRKYIVQSIYIVYYYLYIYTCLSCIFGFDTYQPFELMIRMTLFLLDGYIIVNHNNNDNSNSNYDLTIMI